MKAVVYLPTSFYSLPIRITAENQGAVRAWMKQFSSTLSAVLLFGFACDEVAMVSGSAVAFSVATELSILAALVAVALRFVGLRKLR